MPRPAELVEFVETSVFTKRVTALGLDDAVRELQLALLQNPEAGAVDPGTGGLRKVRMADPSRGKGKRGGARVHYLWLEQKRRIYMLYVYAKNETQTLTPDEKKQLRSVVQQIRQQP
jgi:hypothetical protein